MANFPQFEFLKVLMQNPFHCRKVTLYMVAFAAFIASIAPCSAETFTTGRPGEKAAEFKLIAAESLRQEIYHAGIEIKLKPGALTYWRQPGDAGVPPVFSFEGSVNLASARVLYPAPLRIREDEGEAFGYHDKVVFPLHVTPRDKTMPVILKLTMDYAVCERICIPVKSQGEITLPSAEGTQEALVAAAEARLPTKLTKAETAEKVTVTAARNTPHPTWHLIWKGETAPTDLFVEAPEGWYFETKKTSLPNEFAIVAVESPKGDIQSAIPLTLTLTGQSQNFEFNLLLDPFTALSR
jgi:DsbC/DsbD-like thiol-disulfide interchange protein